ncbi:MAG TPA: hypothetical protein VFQ54_06505 [Thermomicrobiales bacterium]|nr:hypothetical protein [Thermomicrobiales bacterium]
MGPQRASVVYVEPLLGKLKKDMFADADWSVSLHRFRGDVDATVDQVRADDPDLVVLDYFFRDEDAAESLIRQLQAVESPAPIPILVCRERDQSDQALRQLLPADSARIITRPYTVEEFMGAARDLVAGREHQADI